VFSVRVYVFFSLELSGFGQYWYRLGDCQFFGVFKYKVHDCDSNDITTSFGLCRIVKLMMRKSRESMVNAHETSTIQNECRAVAVSASQTHLH
jgi:hypothetical protein